jgi:hypothetical protein
VEGSLSVFNVGKFVVTRRLGFNVLPQERVQPTASFVFVRPVPQSEFPKFNADYRPDRIVTVQYKIPCINHPSCTPSQDHITGIPDTVPVSPVGMWQGWFEVVQMALKPLLGPF